jgi:hypothetical protein
MRKKLSKVDVTELLANAPISRVSDIEIWTHLVSPQVKSLLGPIESTMIGPTLMETAHPLFTGDEISNLNNHLLYGGKSGFVRFPYVATVYKTTYGALVIKRDPNKFKVSGWIGDVRKGKADLIYKCALRDRRYDGTLRGNDCALMDFTYDQKDNAPISPELKSVEVSIYAFQPGSRIGQASGDFQLESFVANPFTFLDRPELFRQHFDRIWNSQRAPGQVAASISDVAKFIAPNFDLIAARKGYDLLEDAASHYHVAMFAQAVGYRITYEDQAKQFAQLQEGIQRIKKSGVELSRPQESWVAVVQSLPVELIPPQLYLGGPKWLQDNISQDNFWFNKPLTDKARAAVPGTIKREVTQK